MEGGKGEKNREEENNIEAAMTEGRKEGMFGGYEVRREEKK